MYKAFTFLVLAFLLTTQGVAREVESIVSSRATVMQLSVESPGVDNEEIRRVVGEESKRIRSCAEGVEFAGWLKARGLHGSIKITVTPNMLLDELPLPLRKSLLERPVGRATPVYGGENAARVLIRCEPTFSAPRQSSPSAYSQQEI